MPSFEIKSTGLRKEKKNLVWTSKLSKHNTGVTEEAITGNNSSYHLNKSRLDLVFCYDSSLNSEYNLYPLTNNLLEIVNHIEDL